MSGESVTLEGEAITYARGAVRAWRKALRKNIKTASLALESDEPPWVRPLLEAAIASDTQLLAGLERTLPQELLA